MPQHTDEERYREICRSPHVFSRTMLEATLRYLPDAAAGNAQRIRTILTTPPITKPHSAIAETWVDQFFTDFGEANARSIADAIESRISFVTPSQLEEVLELFHRWDAISAPIVDDLPESGVGS